MTREEIKNNVSVSSRLEHITDKEKLKIIDFIIDYSFIDKKEIYTNGSILVPLFRVLDAIAQNGKQYESCEPEHQQQMNTIKIGSQEWATEDLKVSKFRNGEDIPLVTDNEEWTELETAAYCISPKGHYLYNWYAVNDPRGLTPEGFHVPTDEEWTELIDYLGGEEVAGKRMKTEEWGGNNQSGFSALPGGYRYYYNGYFINVGYNGFWWSSSAYGTNGAWSRTLYSDYDYVDRYDYYHLHGFSVRCLKNIQHQREMKTPMQELFYRVEQLRFAKNPIDELMMIRVEMLEKEKEVIVNAYNIGQQIPPFDYAEHYYKKTFKSE